MIKKAVVLLMCIFTGTTHAAETLSQFLDTTIHNNKTTISISPEASYFLQQKLGKASRGFVIWGDGYLKSAQEYHPSNVVIKTETQTALVKTIIKYKKDMSEYFYTITESGDCICLKVKNSKL